MIANDLIPCEDKYKIAAELLKLYQSESDMIASTAVDKRHCLLIDGWQLFSLLLSNHG